MPIIRAELRRYGRLLKPPLFHDLSQVLYLPFDKDDGSYARDRSSYGNHGTLYGPTRVAGKVAGALSFNGSTNRVNIPDASTLKFGMGNFSILLWVKAPAQTSGNCFISKTSPGQIRVSIYTDKWYWRLDDDAAHAVDQLQTYIVDDVWHHVGMVFDRLVTNKAYSYVEGLQVNSRDISVLTGNINPAGILNIGYSGAAEWFQGLMDEIRFFNRALSAAEMLRLTYMRGI